MSLVTGRAVPFAVVIEVGIREGVFRTFGHLVVRNVTGKTGVLANGSDRVLRNVTGFARGTAGDVAVGRGPRGLHRREGHGKGHCTNDSLHDFSPNSSRSFVVRHGLRGDASEDGCAAQLRAADVVAVKEPARGVADGVESGNRPVFVGHHLGFGVDLRTAEGRRNAALEGEGVEGRLVKRLRFGQRTGRIHILERSLSEVFVVVGNELREDALFDVHLFFQRLDRVGLVDLRIHVRKALEGLFRLRPVRVDQVISQVFRRFRGDGRRLLRVRIHFVDKALPAHVDLDPLPGIDDVVRVDVRRTDDRTAVKAVHMHETGAERFGELHVLAVHVRRTAQHEAREGAAHVAAEHFAVGGKAARRDDDAFFRVIVLPAFVRAAAHAVDAAAFVREQFDGLRVEENRDLSLAADFFERANEAGAAR